MNEDIENTEDDLFEHYRIIVDKGQSLIRIDRFLMDRIQNATRNKLQLAIDNDFVKVNEKPIKASYKVKPDDLITIALPTPPRDTELLPENIPLSIVFEDEYLLVVNKPAGMVVHPAHGNWTGTLVNALVHHFQHLPVSQTSRENGEARPGLVHRIDKDTSGLLVIAKTEAAMTHLAKQFYDHSIERTYYALVWGEPKAAAGTINTNLGRSPKDRRLITVYPENEGRNAITHYETLESLYYVSLIACKLETGRTHQIRVHLQHLGYPIFNDSMYGGDKILKGTVFTKYKQFVENCFKLIPRQALHAKSLGFTHPITKEWMQFDSELPEDFSAVLHKWREYGKYTTIQ